MSSRYDDLMRERGTIAAKTLAAEKKRASAGLRRVYDAGFAQGLAHGRAVGAGDEQVRIVAHVLHWVNSGNYRPSQYGVCDAEGEMLELVHWLASDWTDPIDDVLDRNEWATKEASGAN